MEVTIQNLKTKNLKFNFEITFEGGHPNCLKTYFMNILRDNHM